MKLIRTLIDTKRTDGDVPLRPSEIAAKPRSRSDAPVSEALQPEAEAPPAPDDPRLAEYKIDLAALTPRRTPVSTGPKRRKVWDLDAEKLATLQEDVQTLPVSEPDTGPDTLSAAHDCAADRPASRPRETRSTNMYEVPNPLAPRRAISGGRAKTRIMGFGANAAPGDVFDMAEDDVGGGLEFPVGWLVVIKGPGRGKFFALQNVVSTIGRGADQIITLNFGDDTISRNNHAAVAYDDQMNACFLGYGGKANLVRLNGRPVLGTEQLSHGDVIRVGETDLRFVALCGPDFAWDAPKEQGSGEGDG
ncbi:MAG: FHA domain-containing protein [Pseudomonadota bacterium]